MVVVHVQLPMGMSSLSRVEVLVVPTKPLNYTYMNVMSPFHGITMLSQNYVRLGVDMFPAAIAADCLSRD